MSRRKIRYSFLAVLFTTSLILAGVIYNHYDRQLRVIFLDVGQGDAILIEQGSTQILIDGGTNGQRIMEKLGEYVPFWDRNMEILIATHPDQDHLSGLIDVMEKYNVSEIIDNGVASDSQVYKKYKEVLSEKNINHMEGKSGIKIKLADGAEIEVLYPDGTQAKDNPKDTNLSSITAKLAYGENSFLFTGDLPLAGENNIVSKNIDVSANVLKVAHHGSKYSTGVEFLEAVRPEAAVISAGKNNRYGHPAPEILERLLEHKINIRRTDEERDIEYICNFNTKCKSHHAYRQADKM